MLCFIILISCIIIQSYKFCSRLTLQCRPYFSYSWVKVWDKLSHRGGYLMEISPPSIYRVWLLLYQEANTLHL